MKLPPMIRLHVGLIAKLDTIAVAEGCDTESLVVTACELLVDAYAHRPVTITTTAAAPEPATFSTRTVKSTVAAAPGMVTTMASGAVGLFQPSPASPPEKRGRGRPRKVRLNPDERCFVCDHTRGEHCGENGRCLSARCVCTDFT